MDQSVARALRALPSVDALASAASNTSGEAILPEYVTAIVRRVQEDARSRILAGDLDAANDLLVRIQAELKVISREIYQPLINATGVIVQTNLGRAPVSNDTAAAMGAAAAGYLALETDLESGERGGRGAPIAAMLRALTGAPRTVVVNNNASAVLLALAATCFGREVIVSRGEAIEIGGGFRIPDVLRQSGATLVEVGTTNRTYVSDYDAAIGPSTGAILSVHASNFAMVGFTARPALRDLVELAHERGVLVIEDAGSGCLLDTTPYGLAHEPTLAESIAAGVDIVCASGDKLLGGPQAGLIIGEEAPVEVIRRHPLARALRADKTCLAGLAATLRHYLRGDATEHVPVWWSISRQPDWLRARVAGWLDELGLSVADITPTKAVVGGGALPGKVLASFALAIHADHGEADSLARRLRTGHPGVIPRIEGDRVLLDARTILPDQDADLLRAVRTALSG